MVGCLPKCSNNSRLDTGISVGLPSCKTKISNLVEKERNLDIVQAKMFKIKMRLLGKGFHTFLHNVLFPSSTDMRSHNLPPSEPNVLVGTNFPLQSMWDLTIHSPLGPSVLGTLPDVHPPSRLSVLTETPPGVRL